MQESITYIQDVVNALGEFNSKDVKSFSMYDTSELRITLQALRTCFWCKTSAAKAVGVTYRVFDYKCRKYGIVHPFWQSKSEYENIRKLKDIIRNNGNGTHKV